MNTKDNKRRLNSRKSIEKAFVEELQKKELSKITVSDICKKTGFNRSTFYANYADIYELADCIKKNLDEDIRHVYSDEWENHTHSYDFLKLFRHIKENPVIYETFFKLDYDESYRPDFYDLDMLSAWTEDRHLEYRVEFFKCGFTAIIKMWLKNGCKESPEEMSEILKNEYNGRKAF